jgi:cytochrome c553
VIILSLLANAELKAVCLLFAFIRFEHFMVNNMLTYFSAVSSQCRPKLQSLAPRWLLVLGLLALAATAQAKPEQANAKEIELGRRIYMEGILPSGKPLQGKRQKVVSVEGAVAACENCHRPSGMGSLEGNVVAPPINGRFLFAKPEERLLAIVDTRAASNLTRAHAAYTEASLAKAVREGVNVGGGNMNPLMPHYDLNKTEIKALMAYLKQLSAQPSPGVSEDSIEFAAIVTPDTDAKQRETMLSMVQSIFAQRNSSQEARSGQMKMPLDLIPRTPRTWKLSTWELKGEANTWAAQLQGFYRQKPVFAVVAGLSNADWTPVNDFCQQEKIPCMLPSVDVVPDKPGFYNLYFSHGVSLEAEVLAKHLKTKSENNPHRLIQIIRDNQAGRVASEALTKALNGSNIQVETRKVTAQDATQWQAAFKDVAGKDELMLWLGGDDLAEAGKAVAKLDVATAYLSGFLAKENFSAIPKTWANVRVVYPYELGENRTKNLNAVQQWMKTWNLAVVNEPQQAEVFFNMLFLTDLVSQMLDNLHRDYMIERAEDMLSVGSNVSPYPHLGLSRGQRYASKGAYIAKLADNGKLVAESDWIVP